VTRTVLPASSEPQPLAHVILFFLKRNSTPRVFAPTTSSLRFIICARFSVTPPTENPCSSACMRVNSKCSDDCSSAFDGMQPTFTHVPPSVLSPSTQTVESPSWAERIAAPYPPGPPPMMRTSGARVESAIGYQLGVRQATRV